MAEINAQMVGKLREKTGQRLMDCKKALTETAADSGKGESAWIDAAEGWLRKKGLDKGSAMGEKGAAIGKDIAMHIVFAKPSYLTRDEVPQELLKKEMDIAMEKLKSDPKNANKPANILEKIVAGQVNKFYSTLVLPDQDYYKD